MENRIEENENKFANFLDGVQSSRHTRIRRIIINLIHTHVCYTCTDNQTEFVRKINTDTKTTSFALGTFISYFVSEIFLSLEMPKKAIIRIGSLYDSLSYFYT